MDLRSTAALLLVLLAGTACAPRFLRVNKVVERPEEVVERPADADAIVESSGCERREYWSQLVYAPDPDYREIVGAWPRRAEELQTTVAFCIDEQGRTDAITIESTSGLEAIDRAAAEAVAKWRAKPHVLDGKGIRACTAWRFEIAAIRPERR